MSNSDELSDIFTSSVTYQGSSLKITIPPVLRKLKKINKGDIITVKILKIEKEIKNE